jgi:hypothetical protein
MIETGCLVQCNLAKHPSINACMIIHFLDGERKEIGTRHYLLSFGRCIICLSTLLDFETLMTEQREKKGESDFNRDNYSDCVVFSSSYYIHYIKDKCQK